MSILVTGKGGSGSWQIRGQQLGAGIGATVKAQASRKDIEASSLVIVVKRATPTLERELKASGKPVLLDVVDGWPQGRGMDVDAATGHVLATASRCNAQHLVFATVAQSIDIAHSGFTLKHHANPAITRQEIREQISTVAYEGSPRYLASWAVEAIVRRGWKLQNSLAGADLVIATRKAPYNDDVTRRWKSNVKLANCQAAGLPCLLPRESGYLEEDQSGPVYYCNRGEFEAGLDYLECFFVRRRAAMVLRAGTPRLQDIAARYRHCIAKFFGPEVAGATKRSGF